MSDKGVSFDEDVIKEHDKLRGTRMKIDEPNTPYNHEKYDTAMGDDDENEGGGGGAAAAGGGGLDAMALQAKLAAVEKDDAVRDEDETLENRRKREKKEKFKGKMASHYGGMGALLRKGAAALDDEDDED